MSMMNVLEKTGHTWQSPRRLRRSASKPRVSLLQLIQGQQKHLRIVSCTRELFPDKNWTHRCLSPLVRDTHAEFSNTMLQELDAGNFNVRNIWLSDIFSLDGFLNKQNWHICEQRILMLPYCHPCISLKPTVKVIICSKSLLDLFSDNKPLLQLQIWTFGIIFWRFNMFWGTVQTPCGSPRVYCKCV